MSNIEFESSEILLEIVKSEYQNEISRTSCIDTKVGITLPIITTYFFQVLQSKCVEKIFSDQINTQNIATILFSVCGPLIYVSTLVFAIVALICLFYAILTRPYRKVDAKCFNTRDKMSLSKNEFSAVMVTYFARALEHNHLTNDKRADLYQYGWIMSMYSLAFFSVICIFK